MKALLLAASAALLLPVSVLAQSEAPTPVPPEGSADLGSLPVQALSESAPPPAPAEESKAGPRQLGEVVVTAQKTKQSLRRVPASVTALSGDFIKETGAADLADVSLYVPNSRVDADDIGSPQVFIRGFGTNAFNPSFESSVGFVQDDLYFGRPGYFTESMFDIDRVEILRGPQGTLFGKNTIAGVFNVISKGPTSEPSADARYFYGGQGEQRLEGGMGAMFGEHFGGRVGFLYREQDGQTYNQFLDRYEDSLQQQAVRGKLKLASGIWSSELMLLTSETTAPFWPFQLMKLDADTRTYLQHFDANIEDDPYNFRTSFDTPGWIEKGSDTVALKNEWAMGPVAGLKDFNTVLVLGGSRFRIDQLNELDVSPADIARLDNHEDHQQLTAELRFTGKADSLFGLGTGLEFVGGLFRYDSDYTLLARIMAGQDLASYLLTDDAAQLASGGALSSSPLGFLGSFDLSNLGLLTGPLISNGDYYQFDYTQKVAANALFGQFTWNWTKHFAITPGVRLGMEEKKISTKGQSHCQIKDALPPGIPAPPCVMELLLGSSDYDQPDKKRKEYDISPKLSMQYFADHGVNYYVSYARGDKSGGINAISLTGEKLEYNAETAQTYELGAKGRFFNKTLNTSLTLYQTDFDNLQVLAFNGVLFDVSNAGTARSRGLEADFQWLTPYRPLRIVGSLGLLDAKYLDYPGAPAPISQGIGAKQNLGGQRIAFAPKATGTLTPSLTYEFGEVAFTLAGDIIYQGDQYTDVDLDPATHVDPYYQYAARFIVADVRERWSLSVGGTNLGDKRVLNQVTDATFFPGTYFAQQAPGRQLFAVVGVKF
ncbi:TonB-dependent receptor [Stagnimonas aquatica]|uniref:TonB-dependent receptor n=1 Tax=Stagnimonas aquatica TaxID=2689987 RepID=A0A3N0VFN3_9GAMM|nr:TonB-dependent receptor [Stagnimonas aquatica]ROH91078.1 TonB-dependent receptor [Stagnimonas aquatica]